MQIEAEELPVVGIVDGQAVVENGAIILSLRVLQEITANEGKVNFVDVRFTPGTTKDGGRGLLREQIKEIFPEGRAMVASEVVGTSQGFRIARAMSWSTSLLAIIVGVLGVMNTMLMTVFERTHEIGILLAVGWKRSASSTWCFANPPCWGCSAASPASPSAPWDSRSWSTPPICAACSSRTSAPSFSSLPSPSPSWSA